MNQRISRFLSAENISQAQLAETLGVAKASVSHIIAGRNNPGYDFIKSMADHYPSLNIEWLITGKGKMYKTAESNVKTEEFSDTLFSVPAEETPEDISSRTEPEPSSDTAVHNVNSRSTIGNSNNVDSGKNEGRRITNGKIQKIIVFYSDGTWQDLQ